MKQLSNFPKIHHFLCTTLFIISNFDFALSEIKDAHIIDDSRPMIMFERFGFSQGGNVDISVKGVSWKSKNPKAEFSPSSMGFFLARDSSFIRIINESQHAKSFCLLSSRYVKLIFRFDTFTFNSTNNGSILIEDPDEYNLVFGNCQPEFEVSMYVHTEMYNLQHGIKDFLPAGQTELPRLYFIFFLIYTCLFVLWVFTCIKQRPTVDKIHIIMGALLFVKALKMICASEDKMYVSKTGTPHGWDVAFYIFGFFKGIMLFTVIVLIGTGWSFLKPYLQEREKNVLMIVIPLQVLENIAYVVISETGPATKDWMTWNQMFLLIDIICCCAVFFPIIWSIRSLREASKTDGKAARNLQKLTLFKQFYIFVVGYLYFTRVVVSSIGALLDYRYEWIMNALAEAASLVFYVFIFSNFQPTEKNPYLLADDEEEMVASQILQDDDSFEL
ncbi:Lung seven transmembrane receptor family protein [Euphorbia peplus]|nr:Lung seven transmembrane receptor family protein [Euphorbia peplus]